MTETLEDYLADEYHKDMDDIRELENKLERAASVFIYECDDGRWPYEIKGGNGSGPAGKLDKVSHGTQAMIAAALSKMTGLGDLASGRPARMTLKCKADLETVTLRGIQRFEDSVAKDQGLVSSSFGRDDPITLSHVADLWRGMKDSAKEDVIVARQELLRDALEELRSLSRKDPAAEKSLLRKLPVFRTIQHDEPASDPASAAKGGKEPTYLRNAFVPLRIVRALKDLETAGIDLLVKPNAKTEPKAIAAGATGEQKPEMTTASGQGSEQKQEARPDADHPPEQEPADPRADFNRNYKAFFEATLHQQLSFSSIPDSRFDPAELTFCLEGLMLCGRHVVDEELFERVLRVLQDKQADSAHWHPNKPIYATPQGLTMLPVSVEGAISLLRSVAMMDRQSDFQHVSIRVLPMARRFWKWLRARIAKFEGPQVPPDLPDIENKDRYKGLLGWHSDHVNNPELIHLWDTSQVIEFMLAYRELLQRSIAGQTLRLSRLQINVHARAPQKEWKGVMAKSEPRPGAGPGRKVYKDIGEDFIVPWAAGTPRNYSMLVYGPPGTGKSSLAENIAETLGMRMVTVTVSDFLGRGSANMEARAKAIFQTLEAQSDTVILFDEIDSFLLDRDGDFYEKQETVFKFLTPGMLTKINDLRKKEKSIFIIATNYAHRVDPAIKRKGRIDKQYLLQLPNRERRLEILERLGKFSLIDGPAKEEIAANTLFFGFSDLKGAVRDASIGEPLDKEAVQETIKHNTESTEKIQEVLQDPDRKSSTSIGSHLAQVDEVNYPVNELAELIILKREICRDYDVEAMKRDHPKAILTSELEAKLKKELESKDHG